MRFCRLAVVPVLGFLVLGMAYSKPKKTDVPAVFQNARYVYVESVDGDVMRPGLYPDDRRAIVDVEDSVRDWNRYTIATRREDADLVFVIRKGRAAAAQLRGNVSVGSRTQPGQYPNQSPAQGGGSGGVQAGQARDGVGTEAEVGPDEDLLRVFIKSGDGKLVGPVWTRELDGGLDAPNVQLVQQLKAAVERAYPQTPPAPKP